MVVHPVVRWRYNQPTQHRFRAYGKAQVGVVKERCRERQGIEDDERRQVDVEEDDDRRARAGGDQHFAGMEANRAGSVEKLIEMMDTVKAPEKRPAMIGAVPSVGPQIEDNQVKQQSRPEPEIGARPEVK
jgi:hypothetical protein